MWWFVFTHIAAVFRLRLPPDRLARAGSLIKAAVDDRLLVAGIDPNDGASTEDVEGLVTPTTTRGRPTTTGRA
jgi:hypothetical protein